MSRVPLPISRPLQAPAEWEVDTGRKTARHVSGLVVRIDRCKGRPAALDILGLEKLSGTEWASRANVLIEQGIALLDA